MSSKGNGKNRRSVKMAIAVLVACVGCVSYRGAEESGRMTPVDQVSEFKPTQPTRWSLKNGLEVIFLRDEELPLVKGRLLIRGGALWAEGFPLGTTSAMGDAMRAGGAGALSADALDKELEKLAAGISSSFSSEFGAVSFSCLSNDVERVFGLFSDVVMRPRFESERLALWKGQSLEGIRRRVEDPSTVAGIAFTQLVYGDSMYGRVSRAKDIASIARAHLVELYKHLVRPDGAILVVTGNINQEKVAELAEKYLGNWTPRGSMLPAAPPIEYEPKPGIYFINLPFAQASVKFGHLGVPRFTPDYPAIDVFNEVFGSGGFGSRLMKRVRTELGLSYGIYGGIAAGRVRGTNYVFLQTKADSAGAAIDESIGVLERLRSEAPAIEELSEKKLAIRNSYVFNFSSKDEIAGRVASQELLEYPKNYDETYLQKIQSVEPKEISAVVSNRWDTSKLIIVVVGNDAALAALQKQRDSATSHLQGLQFQTLEFNEALLIPRT